MDNRRELTQRLIADSFKELLVHRPFEKISIMNITDEAGIRRPSFYNHFQDKYDLLEWIVNEDVILPAEKYMEDGSRRRVPAEMIAALHRDAPFYRKAFAVTGQNGFEEAFIRRLEEMILRHIPSSGPFPDIKLMAHYNAQSFVAAARSYLSGPQNPAMTQERLTDYYLWLCSHPVWLEGK